MAITDFGTLKAAVIARSLRTDLTSLVPDFIRAAHDVIVNRLSVCSQITVDGETEALPTGAREVSAILVDPYPANPLGLATEAQMTGMGTGVPQFYRIDGTNIVFGPTPNASFNARLLHKMARAMFSADADTNIALTRYPLLYLYGAMAEVFSHTRNIEQEVKYRQLFAAGIEEAQTAELDDLYASATLQPRSQGVI
jgi:hypothetical protein